MIDALFGSKTRVKLLHLFLNNPEKSFYVREITRIIDEQINSVRRELANMLSVGIITSDNANNKLYYKVNQRYDYFLPLKNIFGDNIMKNETPEKVEVDYNNYKKLFLEISGLRLVIFAGILVKGSASDVDILFVGNGSNAKIKTAVKHIESIEGRDINYSVLSYDEFYYRLSVRDKFVTEILNDKHNVVIDEDNILKEK